MDYGWQPQSYLQKIPFRQISILAEEEMREMAPAIAPGTLFHKRHNLKQNLSQEKISLLPMALRRGMINFFNGIALEPKRRNCTSSLRKDAATGHCESA